MSEHDSLLNKGWALLIIVLTPILTVLGTLIGSKVQSGNWLTWLKAMLAGLSTTSLMLIGSGLVAVFIAILVFRRISRLKERNLSLASTFPGWGYTRVGQILHSKVIWRVMVPSDEMTDAFRVTVGMPPYCPKCDTELEETGTFFGRYRWTCVRCGFSCKNARRFVYESDRAERLAQSYWEKEGHRRPDSNTLYF
jgi:hypothetical protein